MEKILEALFRGEPVVEIRPEGEEYNAMWEELEQTRRAIEQTLDEEGRALLDKLDGLYVSVWTKVEEAAFIYGTRFSRRLLEEMSE